MNKILYKIFMLSCIVMGIACSDDSLDPMNTNSLKKGTLLALRGTQLDNIYWNGEPGAEFFPRIISGTEKFEFDAEFLSEDPTSLESFDIYVIKRVGSQKERVFLKNVSASEFKQTDDYVRPWVSVSLDLTDILAAIGITDYTTDAAINELLTTYKFGINIEIDLNLKDGSKVLAEDLVAAGLYQSDQFYPAQKLTYTVTDYCSYDASSWAGDYEANEFYPDVAYGPYTITFVQDSSDPHKFTFNNFWDSGISAYVVFTESTDPDTQIVEFPEQDDGEGTTISGAGTYDQCTNKMVIETTYGEYTFRYEFQKQ